MVREKNINRDILTLQISCEEEVIEDESEDMVMGGTDNVGFSSGSLSSYPRLRSQPAAIREGFSSKSYSRRFMGTKAAALRNFMTSGGGGSKIHDQPDNALNDFCRVGGGGDAGRAASKGRSSATKLNAAAGTSSSSESSPSSTSLRQRISNLENFGKSALFKPKNFIPSMLISSANRRWGNNKNGECGRRY